MKYIESMSMCLKDTDEGISNLDIPSQVRIDIDCPYELDGFCLNGMDSCDFNDILSAENAKSLNQ